MISHFKEPMDIACSNFTEATAVFGGRENLRQGLETSSGSTRPSVIGIATTCLAETIGEDVAFYLREIRADGHRPCPRWSTFPRPVTPAPTPKAFTPRFVRSSSLRRGRPAAGRRQPAARHRLAGRSPLSKGHPPRFRRRADRASRLQRHARRPDLERVPADSAGRHAPGSHPPHGPGRATIEFGSTADPAKTAGALLEERFGVPRYRMPLPIGVSRPTGFFEALEAVTGRPAPAEHADERGRLIDAYVDAHKYVFGKRAVVYGEQDLVVGYGLVPGGDRRRRRCSADRGQDRPAAPADCRTRAGQRPATLTVLEGVDFAEIEDRAAAARARSGRRQQQGLRLGAEAGGAAGPRGLSHPRPHRRPAPAARRLSRCAAVVRSHCQRVDRSRARRLAGGLQLHVTDEDPCLPTYPRIPVSNRRPPSPWPHPSARGSRLQRPVQFLQADVRLRQREPAGRDHGRAHAAAGTATT